MNRLFITSIIAAVFIANAAYSAAPGQMGGPSWTNRVGATSGRVVSAPQIAAMASTPVAVQSAAAAQPAISSVPQIPIPVNTQSPEKTACNNAGTQNGVFIWAARNSVGSNSSYLREDIANPDNNACFVRVDLVSNDPRISLSGIESRYYMTDMDIECGGWVDRGELEKRILAAKKSGRTWGTVAGAVGGAAVGVGVMELFGNKAIGGKVQGQKALSEEELLYSQMSDQERVAYATARSDLWKLCADLRSKGATAPECE